jgi:hypothetical protein
MVQSNLIDGQQCTVYMKETHKNIKSWFCLIT